MSPALPDGEPAPPDGSLPPPALDGLGERPFGLYVHVPFCATRCGYCDFNTYTATELGAGASAATYAELAIAEIRFARRVLGANLDLPVASVFFGGGTPTLLPPNDLVRVLRAIEAEFGLAPGAEVTTEANPDSVDRVGLAALREGGFTRVSFGMQSASPHVLAVLDRTHTPGRAQQAVSEAREAGFEHINLDLIYGTPGETAQDWEHTVQVAVDTGVDHLSAYALTVEPGTRLAARVQRGEVPAPDDDDLADRYLAADDKLTGAGFAWYEVSNWARSPAARCRHNLGYWRGGDWWGVGPGAHSHVGGVRWWNVKHPAAYAARVAGGVSAAQAREVLDEPTRGFERLMLGVRSVEGHPLADLTAAGRAGAARLALDGLIAPNAYRRGWVVLTRTGRLLGDAVVRELTG